MAKDYTTAGPTSGQCDLLAFFGRNIPKTKREASMVITALLEESLNQRRWIAERARRCVASMELRTETSSFATYNVARVLLHGFDLTVEEARPILEEWNARCPVPREPRELEHKLRSTDAQPSQFGRGYLVADQLPSHPNAAARQAAGREPEREVRKKVEFDAKKLADIAAPWRGTVSLVWLANRSAVDPATVGAVRFLELLYGAARERVLVFSDYYSQGQYLWPDDAEKLKALRSAKLGVWFLPAPVDGQWHPNSRSLDKAGHAKMSRRSEESVLCYRYLLLESDKADVRDWLGFIVQVPLRIEALYTSGGRSIHALVRVDCKTKQEWEAEKNGLMPFLMGCVMVGGDRGVLSGVRLSRLPGCYREGKEDAEGNYVRFAQPQRQKLLFVRPGADDRPIFDLPPLRDVEATWCQRAAKLVDGYEPAAGDPTADQVKAALEYYSGTGAKPVSASCRKALEDLMPEMINQ